MCIYIYIYIYLFIYISKGTVAINIWTKCTIPKKVYQELWIKTNKHKIWWAKDYLIWTLKMLTSNESCWWWHVSQCWDEIKMDCVSLWTKLWIHIKYLGGRGGGGLKSIRLPCEKYAKYINLIGVKQQLHKKVAMSADIT